MPDLDLFRAEYDGFIAQLGDAADVAAKSEDRTELAAFLDQVANMRADLYRADGDAGIRLLYLAIEERWAGV